MDGFKNLRVLLPKVNNTFFSIVKDELEQCGITLPQIFVLGELKDAPKTIGEIAKSVGLSYSTVSGIVDRLERDGFVQRERDHRDRRVVWVSVTDSPECFDQKVPFMKENYIPDIFDGIKDSELEQLNQSLELLDNFLEKKRASLAQERGSEKK
ncbi:MarR family winged helix-turn-helix transcriptional regulator [Brevibacillus sp. SYSU BS000544]|uniref:MarR family winged helix-turn-helix transcriptional regulator n=1 Tax=Brevibacillus sp. SYSU BS000544 TaxID=3416443 RepID=UPI003CE5C11E